MSRRAVVIGESLTDVVRGNDLASTEFPGGSPLNVAVTLGRLGVPTTLVTSLGDDPRARHIESHLASSGVRIAEGAHRLGATSSAIAHVGADGSARYEFDVSWDPPPIPALNAATVHAGSLALFLQPGCKAVTATLRRVAGRSLITLDPNIRSALLPRADTVRDAFERLVALAGVVKLSEDDAAWLFPGASSDEVLARLLHHGARISAMTRGAAGVVLAARSGAIEIGAPAVDVADTIGAGDAFMGGMVARILETDLAQRLLGGDDPSLEELADVGRFAAQVAAATVARHGADPPYRDELTVTERRSTGGQAMRTS